LHLSDVVLENSCLDAFSTSQSLHNSGILVSDIALDHVLNSFYFIEAVVKSHDLANQLRSLRHQTSVNRLVHGLEAISKGLLHVANTMELGVMRPHDSTVVANELFASITEVSERLVVEHADARLGYMRIQNRLRSDETLGRHVHSLAHRVKPTVWQERG